jgi:AAA domain-containing protein
MPIVHLDFETRSKLPIDRVSTSRYAGDPSTEVLCAAYAVDDGAVELWKTGELVPDVLADPSTCIAAHGATFEHAILEHILAPRFGWKSVPIDRFVCTMARARAAALPGSLDGAAAALDLAMRKDAAGAKLMREIASCKREPTAEELERLYAYCRQDVEVERELHRKLPPLTADEHALWVLDHKINERGIPIDRELAIAVADLAKAQRLVINAEIAELTGGRITTANQRDRILAWVAADGYEMDGLTKADVKAALANGAGEGVRKLLELRAIGSQAAAAKVKTLLIGLDDDDRLRDTLVYHGSATGRWSGRKFQPQNLKKPAKTLDVEAAIAAIKSGELARVAALGQPLSIAADVSRGLICAKPGKVLLGADFSAIESRVLAWLAGEDWKLAAYRKFDETADPALEPYCVIASKILGRVVTPDDEVGRGTGKVADLAGGFGGSVGAWRKFAPKDTRSDDEIKADINAFRRAHPKTVKFWAALELALKRAVKRPGKQFVCGRITAESRDGTLFVKLPSGRSIAYPGARLVDGKFEDTTDIAFMDNAMGKWRETVEWYGTFVENVVQGTARDILAAALVRLEAAGFEIVAHVHDEAVAEIAEGEDGRQAEFVAIMSTLPDWADGLPIAAKAWRGPRFIKSDRPAAAEPEADDTDTVTEDEPMIDRDPPPWEEPPHEEEPRTESTYKRHDVEAGKPYAPVRAGLLERGFKLVKSFAFTLPGEAEPLFYEDRYAKPAKNGAKPPKECRFRHVDGGAELTDTGPRRILYGLPQLVRSKPSVPVFVAEGAAKCDPLLDAGLVAVAAPYHTFKDECATALAGRHVIYLEDHDLPDKKGRIAAKEFSERAQRQLSGLVASFRLLPAKALWKNLGRDGEPPHGFDVKDWLDAGGKAEKLIEIVEPQGAKNSFEVTSAADLQRMDFAEPKFIIPGFVAEGVTLFAGKPKIGKSWLVLHACWAIASGGGEVTLGNIKVEEGDVIYAALEDNPRRMKSRLKKLFGDKPWPRALEFVYRMKKLKEGGVAQLRSWIEAKKKPKLVVIDTLKMVRTPAGKGQNYYEADYDSVIELRDLAAEFGIAIIVVHHQRKAEAEDLFDTVSGTLGLTGAVDTIMIIDRTANGTVLAARGRDVEEINQAVEFNDGVWKIVGSADFVRVSTERRQVLEALEEAKDQPLSAQQIAREIGGKANSVMKLLHKLAKEGLVSKSGYGKYVLNTGLD